jgi:hypothetical protein
MAAMTDRKCKCCGAVFSARIADVKRGWSQYCTKSCKARVQERKNGQYRAYLQGRGVSNLHPARLKNYSKEGYYLDDSDTHNVEWREEVDDSHPFSSEALGQWQ